MDQSLYGMLMRVEAGVITETTVNSQIVNVNGYSPDILKLETQTIQKRLIEQFYGNPFLDAAVVGTQSLQVSHGKFFYFGSGVKSKALALLGSSEFNNNRDRFFELVVDYSTDFDQVKKLLERESSVYVDYLLTRQKLDSDHVSSAVGSLLFGDNRVYDSVTNKQKAKTIDEVIAKVFRRNILIAGS